MRASFIAVALQRCADVGRPAPQVWLGNLIRFVRTQHTANFALPNPQHQFGHGPVMTDEDYLCRAQKAVELPCLLKSQDFLHALRNPKTYSKALALIEQGNAGTLTGECKEPTPDRPWDTLIYRSRFLTTPDQANTLGRFLVVVPGQGEQPDRWIQFGIWTPEDACYTNGKKDCPPVQNVSVVAVKKSDGLNPPSTPPLVPYDAITDWWRCFEGNCKISRSEDGATLARNACNEPRDDNKTVQLRYRLQVKGETDDCQRCHKMMPISIHPKRVYTFDKGALKALPSDDTEKQADRVNDRIRKRKSSYGRPPAYSTGPDDTTSAWENYGEWGLGSGSDMLRSDEWIKACSAPFKLGSDSRDKVRDAMNCSDCHGARLGAPHGVLNYPQGTDKRQRIQFSRESPLGPNIVRAHILNGVMPPKAGLKQREREALFACLSLEYFNPAGPSGVFVDWLRQQEQPSTMQVVSGQAAPDAGGQHVFAFTAGPARPSSPVADFKSYCSKCHAPDGTPTADAPGLRGIVGRQIASTSFPDYSDGLLEIGHQQPPPVWDEPGLMDFLKDPDGFLSARLGRPEQSEMTRKVSDEGVRRSIVNYLNTIK